MTENKRSTFSDCVVQDECNFIIKRIKDVKFSQEQLNLIIGACEVKKYLERKK